MGDSVPEEGYDAIICMGNSFAHLPDYHGDNRDHVAALKQFHNLLKAGGILIIDHRNYDYILDHGKAPSHNIYYDVCLLHYQYFSKVYYLRISIIMVC